MLELKETNHSYYCSESNYYSNEAYDEFDTWEDFKFGWLDKDLTLDHDLNLCFRYDVLKYEDKFELDLFFIQQRKGIFYPVVIKSITEEDLSEINTFLKSAWEYHKNQWAEINEENISNSTNP
jgi:hypothetical protein